MAEAPKTNGFPLKWFKNQEFVRNLYECAICLNVVKDAVQIRDCGHQFCRGCLDDVLKSQSKCPNCRIQITDEMAANRAIANFEVNCPCNECDWTGTLSSLLDEHNERCLFRIMGCWREGCNEQVIRRDYLIHAVECKYRTVVCEHCSDQHVYKDTSKHLDLCRCLPVECENKCSEKSIPRYKMKDHLETSCPHTVVQCQYLEFGCEYECQRYEMEKHLEEGTKQHLDILAKENLRMKEEHKKEMDELKQEINVKHKKEMDELKQEINVKITRTPSFTVLVITDFFRKLSEAKDNGELGTVEGDPFYVSPFGYKVKLRVDLSDTRKEYEGYTGVYLILMKSEHDAILSWPFKKKFSFSWIDQQDKEEERQNIVKTLTPGDQDNFKRPNTEENSGRGYGNFVSHATLKTRQYVKDDTAIITLSIEQ